MMVLAMIQQVEVDQVQVRKYGSDESGEDEGPGGYAGGREA